MSSRLLRPALDGLPRRGNLSDEMRALVRQMIVNGKLAADTRINEVQLAARLGVSRTPLREALKGLVAEGALASEPRRGFFVRPLSVEEFQHLYPIRGILDPEAFRLAGLPSAERVARLERINQNLRAERNVAERIRLDDAWHLELIADCGNPVLIDLIRQFARRTRRYELAFYRDGKNLEISTADHDRLIRSARRRDMAGAMVALRDNLCSGIEPILSWLWDRESGR